MANYCTLFDSYYLDRGLALYHSLEKVAKDFHLYIFAFDKESYNILSSLKLSNAVIVSEEKILDEELTEIKEKRKRAEYCWTCTPIIIEYVLEKFQVEECTYIDADMYFYKEPEILIDELKKNNASIGIIGHRFPKSFTTEKRERLYGKYCVEFNTFFNNDTGKEVLRWWKNKCIESCTMDLYQESFGDQKYLEQWEERFNGVYELKNLGAGVAPWNITDYRLEAFKDDIIRMKYRKNIECELIFYHFQGLRMINNRESHIAVYNEVGRMDYKLIEYIYMKYVEELYHIRQYLKEKYNFVFPESEIRPGERGKRKFTSLKDEVAYIYQCLTILFRGKKNYIKI